MGSWLFVGMGFVCACCAVGFGLVLGAVLGGACVFASGDLCWLSLGVVWGAGGLLVCWLCGFLLVVLGAVSFLLFVVGGFFWL